MTPNLSRITKVNPREIWKHEALDFTKWLAKEENISVLCEELGIEIENIKAEAAAGRYNVDIIGDESYSKRKVIIENQLEPTDHKHLGQILTYASAYDAALIIWVVTDYTEEHRQAIDWFNRNIAVGISFFLVQIEVYKIEDSSPAPKFNIICEPNDWGKTIKKSENGDAFSELKLQQQEFWEVMKEYASSIATSLNYSRPPKPQHWYEMALGTSKCCISLTQNSQKKYVGCELYIWSDTELFKKLFSQKDQIEKELGFEVQWMELPNATASRIIITYSGDPRDRAKWDEYKKWLVRTADLFSKVFIKYIK
jgi:hypothetical protein